MHHGGLIRRAVIPSLRFLERRELQDYGAFDGFALGHAKATVGGPRGEAVSVCRSSGLRGVEFHLLGIANGFAQRDKERRHWIHPSRSVTNHDFAEHAPASVVLPCRLRFGEGKDAVDDRMHRVAVDGAAAEPFRLLRPDLPPTLILAGETDKLVVFFSGESACYGGTALQKCLLKITVDGTTLEVTNVLRGELKPGRITVRFEDAPRGA